MTRPMTRSRGIKQGCPLSPFIFNVIMEAVLESVADEIPHLRLNQEGHLSLPMILAFADDLIIIAETIEDVEAILTKLTEYLSYVGLSLNKDKCKVLIREPRSEAIPDVEVCGRSYKATDPLRYLGVHLTARLERPKTVRTRCRNSIKVARAVMAFLKKYKPSWQLGRLIYETVIAPAMLYGTQVAVLTKYSRKSLRGYERQIVSAMASLCRDEGHANKTISRLLQKRRITKKVRMYQMRWWGHVRRRPPTHPTRLAARLKAVKLRSCRPGFTSRDSVRQNIERYGDLTYEEWKDLAMDREKFQQKLMEIYDKDESDCSDWGKVLFVSLGEFFWLSISQNFPSRIAT